MMNTWKASVGSVQKANIPHSGVEARSGRCQFGHRPGGGTSSKIAAVKIVRAAEAAAANRAMLNQLSEEESYRVRRLEAGELRDRLADLTCLKNTKRTKTTIATNRHAPAMMLTTETHGYCR